jgi:hypothetical protein
MISLVWRTKICSGYSFIRSSRRLELEEDDASSFNAIIDLACGAAVDIVQGLDGLMTLGRVADKYGVEMVRAAVEEEALHHITATTCGELLAGAQASGLAMVERASRAVALEQFEALAGSDMFLELGEEALGMLLADDALRAGREEEVFEALVRWMTAPRAAGGGGAAGVRGEGLLRTIRFPLMNAKYLAGRAREALPGVASLQGLIAEALAIQSCESGGEADIGCEAGIRKGVGGGGLGDRALVPRTGLRVAWAVYAAGRSARWATPGAEVFCVAAVEGRLCCGLWSGDIQVRAGSELTMGHGGQPERPGVLRQ